MLAIDAYLWLSCSLEVHVKQRGDNLIGTILPCARNFHLTFTFTPMSVRGPRKGENYELSVDLNSEYREKRKDAIKRTIASMTVGKGAYNPFHEKLDLVDLLPVNRRQRTLS